MAGGSGIDAASGGRSPVNGWSEEPGSVTEPSKPGGVGAGMEDGARGASAPSNDGAGGIG
jgi:hypothetical protein